MPQKCIEYSQRREHRQTNRQLTFTDGLLAMDLVRNQQTVQSQRV